ncbi:hypothetical protein ACFFQW_24850 [Umezawaea endophytica]|uniref:Uncharacterized protein n=1 Tax=Umezawaea endophytica TaxID=1654476 RepID=A0A9X2VG05_9PSEU|nr:hypothetical protein [Umezawaea endophytica]MCS7475759.1 hypothetical protein [Umezawaea endophytica]
MAQVFIQPSYGTPEARGYGRATLDACVPFTDARYAETLSPADLAGLSTAHPSGSARFWGATAKHDRRMDTVTAGDVVLLTGRKHVLAIGEVGHRFRDPAFARLLWNPAPGKCVWGNVYSLRGYWPVRVPYEAVWALPGFTVGDNFMGLRFLDPGRSAAVLALVAPETGRNP